MQTTVLKVLAISFLVSLAAGCQADAQQTIASIKGRAPLSEAALAKTTWIENFDISPDGKQLVFKSSRSGVYNLWTVPVAGGEPEQLTFYPIPFRAGSDEGPMWSPDGRSIAYGVDQSNYKTAGIKDIHVVSAQGGEPRNLTGTSWSTESNMTWSPDSREIAFISSVPSSITAKITSLLDGGIIRVNVASGQMKRISPRGGGDLQWSPDGKHFLYTARGDVVLLPVDGGEERSLTASIRQSRETQPDWSPDGKKIAFLTDTNGYNNVAVVDVATGAVSILTDSKFDHSLPTWSPDGKSIAYCINQEYNYYIETIGPDGGTQKRITDRPGVSGGLEGIQLRGSLRWTADSRSIVYTYMAPSNTSDLWISEAQGGAPRRITDSRDPSMRNEAQFVWPELMKYKSFDGLEVQGFVYKPKGVADGDQAPFLLFYRANSTGQHPVGYQPYIQYYVSKGYVVFAPNFRGSSGQGRDYFEKIQGFGGKHDIKDALTGVELLVERKLIDRNRMGMVGGSTGGFFVLATLIHEPKLFKAGVSWYTGGSDMAARAYFDHNGSDDMTAVSSWTARMVGGTPLTNPTGYYDVSLIYFMEPVETPLLLLFDEGDVFLNGLTNLVPALAHYKKQYEYKLYEKEPHGWYHWRPENVEDSLLRIGNFVDKQVLGAGSSD